MNSMTTDELIKLIEASCRNGVTQIKLKELEISFIPTVPLIEPAVSSYAKMARDSIDRENFERDGKKLREEEIANLLIENPVAYQEYMTHGESSSNENR